MAGSVAVPAHLPQRRTLDRFHAMIADSRARLVLSTSATVAQHHSVAGFASGARTTAPPIPWLATDEVPQSYADGWTMPPIHPDTVALLQYTSGSTSRPKGVMLSHGNLFHNTSIIQAAFELKSDTGVFWLPLYHDMGLVGGVLAPMLSGTPSVLMPPAAFLQQPLRWLAAISRFGASISGGPSFAYDLCVHKITDAERATLDLSRWNLAFIGAEPTRPDTLERFAAAFAPCGFNAAAFYPCYGLSEATLMVSGAKRAQGATIRPFNDSALTMNRVEAVDRDAGGTRRLVSCGTPVGDQHVVIADPLTCARAAPGVVGEIWVAGQSVGQGYWRKPELSRRSFGAHLRDSGEGPFLRSGDVGFLFEDDLYIIGRQDDLIIIRGRNHHPQDLEATARKSHPLLEAGFGAAFAVDDVTGQRVVLVHEVTRRTDAKLNQVLAAVREAVLIEQGVALSSIVLVRSGSVPRTSSGKVQRRACRNAYLAAELTVLAEHHAILTTAVLNASAAEDSPAESMTTTEPASVMESHPTVSHTAVLAMVCQHALALGGAALSDVTPDTPLATLGLDSMQRVELAAALEKSFACRLPDAEFSPAQTLGALARAVHERLNAHSRADALTGQPPPEHYDFAHFPEYAELKRYERMLKAVAGENPYFRVDPGRATSVAVMQGSAPDVLNFSAYDYIGMAHEKAVANAAKAAIDRYGVSAGASRLVSGEKQVHRDLEQALASFLGTAAALVFVSGHATNVTTIGHLLGPDDLIVYDALAHNSIIQGAQLSGATRRAFAHNDWRALDTLLSEVRHRYRRVLMAIEGVYSMDGDFPDLPRFVELKHKHKALLLVDEAHSLGTMGPTGRGLGEHFGTARTDVDLWMGTLSKSLGSCGGFIAGSAELIEYLAYTAPGFVYSVGVSPPNAAAALAALTLLQTQPQRVSALRDLSALFLNLARERRLNTGDSAGTPVIPVIIGNSVKTLRLARALFDRGINVQPILPPAVPEHSARLRFFITTHHTTAQVRDTVGTVADELAKL